MRKVLKAAVCLGLSLTLGFSTVAFGAEKKEEKSQFNVQVQDRAQETVKNTQMAGRQARKNYVSSGTAKVCYTATDIKNAGGYLTNMTAGNVKTFKVTMPVNG